MKVTAIKTKKVYPDEDLLSLLLTSLPCLKERQLLVISSKIVSLCCGYYMPKAAHNQSKNALIKQEADYYWQSEANPSIQLTMKANSFIPFAGVDESNSAGTYVLFPKHLFFHTATIWQKLRTHFKLKELGVLIVDSQIIPLRKGTLGLGLSWCGFHPYYSYKGRKDCFDRCYEMTDLNLVDAYATSATLEMGEGDEQCPLALIEEAPKIAFWIGLPIKANISRCLLKRKKTFFILFS